jgi:sulfur-carrier protein
MHVSIPSPLLSYTSRRDVEARGHTLAEVLIDLDRQFPGLRFRMIDEQDQLRPHMRVFVGQQELHDLGTPLSEANKLHIIQALSGG